MKTLTLTEARKNLGQLCAAAAHGEAVGIISGSRIFQLKPVEVVSWDDTYASKEYGVTLEEMESFIERADADVSRKEQRGGYERFRGKFDPSSLLK